MSDYTRSKGFGTTVYPVHANGVSNLLKRVEPLLTPTLLKSRHMKGILNIAKRLGLEWTDEELKDQINLAVNQAEIELGMLIFGEQIKEKAPFDYNLYKKYIHIRTEQGPIVSIEDLAVVSANDQNIFRLPAEWIETANFNQRQINVIPLLAAYGVNSIEGSAGNGGIAFLTVLGGVDWIPAYWQVLYTTGMCKDAGSVPIVVNQLVGVMATISILGVIAPNNMNTSVSLSQDGIGQSSTTAGSQIFAQRMQELEAQKQTLMKQIKRVFGNKYFIGTI